MTVLDSVCPDPASSAGGRPAPDPAAGRPAGRVAIIGGGASGVLTALQLLSSSREPAYADLSVTVHEASGVLGRGIAYGTSDPRHLLNVRARHMSAYADVPSDLLDWARRAGRDPDPQGFLPRWRQPVGVHRHPRDPRRGRPHRPPGNPQIPASRRCVTPRPPRVGAM